MDFGVARVCSPNAGKFHRLPRPSMEHFKETK